MKSKSKFGFKLTLGVVAVLIIAGVYGVVQYHHNNVHHTKPVATRQVKKRHRRCSYVNYSNQNVGKLHLIKNTKSLKMPQVKGVSIVAMDAKTGQIVYQRQPNQPLKIGSVTKLMTLYLVAQKASQNHSWNQEVNTVKAPQMHKMSYDGSVGGFEFRNGHRYTVKDLFKAALVHSSNNAAVALGEWVIGNNKNVIKDNRAFVKLMNTQAKAWHIKAHFFTSCGLQNSDIKPFGLKVAGSNQAENLVSAKAVSVIAQHLLKQYPWVLNLSRLRSTKVDGQPLVNHNQMLPGMQLAKPHLHVDGLKTGYTPAAGGCFVGTAKPKHHHHRLITVVLHADDPYTDTASLMDFVNAHSNA